MSNIGHWSFLVGVFLAVFAGFVPSLQTSKIVWVIVILGFVVGLLNITVRETQEFLIAAVALVVASGFALNIVVFPALFHDVLVNLVVFVSPAAIVVALKTVWVLASS
ncbi:hypothetical protein DRJ22_03470 [Candidatus Woesearchaeota archaeon]|nr:MAG: hypothetical protein DRJ22_03470 [Candidatus Woesearchaeota archaeon]